jgi:hypothetical protein
MKPDRMTQKQCEEKIEQWTSEERERYVAEGNSDSEDLLQVVVERVGERIDREVDRNPAFAKAFALITKEMEAERNRPNLGPFTDAEVESFVAASKKMERFEREKKRLLEEILSRPEPVFESESDKERYKAFRVLASNMFPEAAPEDREKFVRRIREDDMERLKEIAKLARAAATTRIEMIEFGMTRMEDRDGEARRREE